MPAPREKTPFLNVHGQRFPQDRVEVFGSKAGLMRLINALIEAVNCGRGGCAFVGPDGFGAEVRAARLDGRRRAEEWRRSGSPYLDVEDPLVARILDLTEENARLRRTVQALKASCQPARNVEAEGR